MTRVPGIAFYGRSSSTLLGRQSLGVKFGQRLAEEEIGIKRPPS